MKKILAILLIIVASFSAKAQFATMDSLEVFINQYVRNSAVQSFTNLRLNTALNGLLSFLRDAQGISNAYRDGDTLRIATSGADTFSIFIGGGGGGALANAGAGFRILITSGTQARTIFVNSGTGLVADSTTNTNGLTLRLDTAILATQYDLTQLGTLSGLTTGRVPYVLTANSIKDESVFNYNETTNILSVPTVQLGTTSTTVAPANIGGYGSVPTTPSQGMLAFRSSDSAMVIYDGSNWIPYKWTKDIVMRNGLSLTYGSAWNIPDTLDAAGTTATLEEGEVGFGNPSDILTSSPRLTYNVTNSRLTLQKTIADSSMLVMKAGLNNSRMVEMWPYKSNDSLAKHITYMIANPNANGTTTNSVWRSGFPIAPPGLPSFVRSYRQHESHWVPSGGSVGSQYVEDMFELVDPSGNGKRTYFFEFKWAGSFAASTSTETHLGTQFSWKDLKDSSLLGLESGLAVHYTTPTQSHEIRIQNSTSANKVSMTYSDPDFNITSPRHITFASSSGANVFSTTNMQLVVPQVTAGSTTNYGEPAVNVNTQHASVAAFSFGRSSTPFFFATTADHLVIRRNSMDSIEAPADGTYLVWNRATNEVSLAVGGAGGGSVSGSGTSGQGAGWTGASSLGNMPIFYDADQIGINAAAATGFSLDNQQGHLRTDFYESATKYASLFTDVTTGSNARVVLEEEGGTGLSTSEWVFYRSSSADRYKIGVNTNDGSVTETLNASYFKKIIIGSTEMGRWTVDGLGLGMTPARMLDVFGDFRINKGAGNFPAEIIDYDSLKTRHASTSTVFSHQGKVDLVSSGDNRLAFLVGGTDRMGMRVDAGTGVNLWYIGAGYRPAFYSNNAQFAEANSSGDFGIGTSGTVSAKLHVVGNVLFTGTANNIGTVTTGVWNGTDIAVADGGTGRSAHTAFTLIAGGTTTTAAQQSITAGTDGQILKSNGSSAIPSWIDNPGYLTAATTTSNNTPTTIATIDATPGENYNVEVIVSAITSTGNAAYSSKKIRQVLLNAGGSFVSGTQTNVLTNEYIGNGDLTTATVDINTTGTDIIIVVTGETGDTITWTVHYRYVRSLVAL